MMNCLVLWELSRKQDYVFKSNRLKECVGASIIIKNLSENFNEYNLKDENFIIKGGGKSLYKFDNETMADEFIKKFSMKLLKDYPGLEFFIVKRPFDIYTCDIKIEIKKLYKELEDKKNSRKNFGGQIGFGIERECESTGYPASSYYYDDSAKKYISSEIEAKRDAEKTELKEYFKDLIPSGYKYSKNIDDLVKKDAKSYIAIIHIDGNGMGKKLKNLENQIVKGENETVEHFNRKYMKVLKSFSLKINECYNDSFKKMASVVVYNKEKLKDISNIDEGTIPLRPLIMAGDDITYICNAYIGVETSRIFIEELGKKNIDVEGLEFGKLNACAGISITKKGYPFIKGYEMAEELCKSSKNAIIERKYGDTSLIDFYIAQGDINKSIYEIREEEYKNDALNINLTMKPLVLDSSKDWKNYDNFIEAYKNVIKAVNNKDIGRNKIKELRSVLKRGKDETKYFMKFYNIEPGMFLRELDGTRGDYCFNENDNVCMYLDAIESIDMFVQLDEMEGCLND